jgi:hypothetical protein
MAPTLAPDVIRRVGRILLLRNPGDVPQVEAIAPERLASPARPSSGKGRRRLRAWPDCAAAVLWP